MNIASTAVPTTILNGSPPTIFRIRRTTGSNRPESIMMPKYRIANISMTPVGARLRIPSSIIGPSCGPKPPITPNPIGTTIRATSAGRRLVMIRYMNTTTMEYARMVNIIIILLAGALAARGVWAAGARGVGAGGAWGCGARLLHAGRYTVDRAPCLSGAVQGRESAARAACAGAGKCMVSPIVVVGVLLFAPTIGVRAFQLAFSALDASTIAGAGNITRTLKP